MEKHTREYGLWSSSLSARSVAQGIRIGDVAWDSDGKTLVWLEERSDCGVLVARSGDDAPRDITSDLSVRARVGYGGGDFVVHDNLVYFASGGQIYRQSISSGLPRPITPPFGQAAPQAVSPDGGWLLYVHSDGEEDCLAVVDTQGKLWPQKLVSGSDFYMQPRWAPTGNRIAWISWDHPHMPWEQTVLYTAKIQTKQGKLPATRRIERVAGGDNTAIFQPEFSPDGRHIAYISDHTGWGNLYLYDFETTEDRRLTDGREELGMPAWIQGMRTYDFNCDGSSIICRVRNQGVDRLEKLHISDGDREALDDLSEYSVFAQITCSPTEDVVAAAGESAKIPPRVITYSFSNSGDRSSLIHRYTATETVPAGDMSSPKPVSWETPGGRKTYGLFYAPQNNLFEADGCPPAILMIHGGPSSQYTAGYHGKTQFFTSRGYAVLEVNYHGSTGYGKEYLESLAGNWGVADVKDAVSGAGFLGDNGFADPSKIAVMGGSAGGYTVLRVLTEYPGVFKAAVCMYGISNLFTLAQDTHKFEAHYLDGLLGGSPGTSDVYRNRSPIFSADKITDPLVVFQGSDDEVVPKSQSDAIVNSLESRGIHHEYYVYEGEGHGFRKTETIESFLVTAERFLAKHILFA